MSQIAIIGAGAWGTGLAIVLGRKGSHRVRLWAYEVDVCDCHRLAEHVAAVAGCATGLLFQAAETNSNPVPIPGVDSFFVLSERRA